MSGELKSKLPGLEEGITRLLDSHMEEEDQSLDTFPLRPSNSGKCNRQLAFELWKYLGREGAFPAENKSPATKRLLSLGSAIEYHSIRNFSSIPKKSPEFKITYKQQVVLLFKLEPANESDKSPPMIKGSVDFALENLKESYTVFLDCKSAKDKFSQSFVSKWDETIEQLTSMRSTKQISRDYDANGRQCVSASFFVEDLPEFLEELEDPYFQDNFTQLNLYCCSDFAKQINVPAGAIYRYNKNDSRHLDVTFVPSQKLFEEFRKKCQVVYDFVMNAESLDDLKKESCDFPLGSIKRAFCSCSIYAGDDSEAGLKAYFATFPPRQWPADLKKLGHAKELAQLFEEFLDAQDKAGSADKLTNEIVSLLGEEKVSKVRLTNGQIYEVKHYKTGGAMNGPRVALKRGKA